MPDVVRPGYAVPTAHELKEIQFAQDMIWRAARAVSELDPEHPALAHLAEATDEVTRVAFSPQVPA